MFGARTDADRSPGGRMSAMQRVLIVDDHAPFRSAVRILLERGGFRVVGEAGDGDGALDAVQQLQPDVVLLDIQLPGDDGFAVCERILDASRGNGTDTPVVVLTSGRPISTFRRRLARSRAAGFIPKTELTAIGLARLISTDALT
jgi:DNA-binding NarL/FixJ family response regulator